MSFFTALYKAMVWAARSAMLVLAVLFLSTLLRFAGKRNTTRERSNGERDGRGRKHGPALLPRF